MKHSAGKLITPMALRVSPIAGSGDFWDLKHRFLTAIYGEFP
jgi:hypothetical protein